MSPQKIVTASNRFFFPPRQGTVRHGFNNFPPGGNFFFEGSAAALPYQKSRLRRGKGITHLPQMLPNVLRVNKTKQVHFLLLSRSPKGGNGIMWSDTPLNRIPPYSNRFTFVWVEFYQKSAFLLPTGSALCKGPCIYPALFREPHSASRFRSARRVRRNT